MHPEHPLFQRVNMRSTDLHRRYLIISPCRDEAIYMRRTLDSVATQSVLPASWIVVDDGSTDQTAEILKEYMRKLPFLHCISRPDRESRSVGPGVVDAVCWGLQTVKLEEFAYFCKLDMDLELPPRYFERLIARMEIEPRLGTTSGKPWFIHPTSGALLPETCGDEMSVGASKFYRVRCFREIGGFVRQVMWDGIDCHRARMLGWIAESVDDRDLRFLHLRPMGSSQGMGIWSGRVRMGFGQYFMGTSPIYFAASAVFRLFKYPALIGSAAMLWGFVNSAVRQVPRYNNPDFRRFLRKYQRLCLRIGKAAATRRITAQQACAWHSDSGPAEPVPQLSSRPRFDVLGLPFDRVTFQAALERCLDWCHGPRAPHTVITANAALLCLLRRNPDLRKACLAGDLIVPDGVPVVWASHLLGAPLPGRVAGVDLMLQLLARGSEEGLKAYFLGARPEIIQELVRRCAKCFPGLQIVGSHHGYFLTHEHSTIVREIRNRSPDLLFVGMPCGFADVWCERYRSALNVPAIIRVGGSFDVIAGFVTRAPGWFQWMGMEWSWRLAQEPRRLWKRYLTTNFEFVWLTAREFLVQRRRSSPPNP